FFHPVIPGGERGVSCVFNAQQTRRKARDHARARGEAKSENHAGSGAAGNGTQAPDPGSPCRAWASDRGRQSVRQPVEPDSEARPAWRVSQLPPPSHGQTRRVRGEIPEYIRGIVGAG